MEELHPLNSNKIDCYQMFYKCNIQGVSWNLYVLSGMIDLWQHENQYEFLFLVFVVHLSWTTKIKNVWNCFQIFDVKQNVFFMQKLLIEEP